MSWKTLMWTSPIEASLVEGILQNEGIPVVLEKESAGELYGLTFGKLGEVKVKVLAADYERAKEILSATKY